MFLTEKHICINIFFLAYLCPSCDIVPCFYRGLTVVFYSGLYYGSPGSYYGVVVRAMGSWSMLWAMRVEM